LSVHLGSGNDTFTNNTPIGTDSIPSTNTCALGNLIDMGAGNDVVNGGTAAEAIFGGAGNDVLNGGGGNDDLDGGSSCFLLARHARPSHRNEFDGSDVLIGGPGDDTAHYDERTDPLNITLDGVANDGAPGEHDNVQTENVIGGSANDQITGDGAANTLDGSAGNDLLQGLGGSDRLIGGPGNDALVGGPARDHNACGSGFDEAVVTPVDTADGDCERTGAQPGTNTARVHGGKAKLWVVCPSQESATCAGTIAVRLHTQQVGTASFSVAAGKRGRSTVQLGKRATNLINRSGSALLTFDVFTNEPDGTSQHRGQLLLTH
jgi:hypothetical protein